MAYITPRVQVQQEFTQVPVFNEQPLTAFIIGPQYNLNRYAVASERPLIAAIHPTTPSLLNAYDPLADLMYAYPNRIDGTTIDQNYVKVYFEEAVAKYFPHDDLGSNSVSQVLEYTTTTTGATYPNRVRFTNAILATRNGFNRSSFFSNRDVKVGDSIRITDENGGVLLTKIRSLISDTAHEDADLAATVGETLASGSGIGQVTGTSPRLFNAAGASFTDTEVSLVGKPLYIATKGTYRIVAVIDDETLLVDRDISTTTITSLSFSVGGVYTDSASAPYQEEDSNDVPTYAWTGTGTNPGVTDISVGADAGNEYLGDYARRILSDRYTAVVTTGGAAAAVRFTVTSQSGAFADKTGVALTDVTGEAGTLVLDTAYGAVKFAVELTNSAVFTVGQSWYIDVKAAVENKLPTTAGSDYTGAIDIVYKLQVQRGGAFYDGTNANTCARIVVTSTDYDSSPVALVEAGVPLQVGNMGVVATFAALDFPEGLIAGDVYYIAATTAKLGPVKSVELADNLSAAALAAALDLTAELYLEDASVEIPKVRSLLDNTVNWSTDTDYLTLKAGVTISDGALLSGITPVALSVLTAKVFIQHRDLVQTNSVSISSISNLSDVSERLGTIHPDNPLSQGVYHALLNSAGVSVYFVGIPSDDLAGYNHSIDLAKNTESVYSFVPMTFDRTVQDAVVAHVNAFSTPQIGRWRISWVSTALKTTELIYDTQEDGSNWLGTVTDDPLAPLTENRLVTFPGAKFITDGVRVGDKVLMNFRLGVGGAVLSDEYTVTAIRTETTLTIGTNLQYPITEAIKMQIKRVYTRDEQAQDVALRGGEFDNRRVRNVFPDSVKYGGTTYPGYILAAALAGLRSGVVPHQGLTNTELLGFDDFTRTVIEFNEDQLNIMAEQGVWIVTQSVIGATPYVRHQLTTDSSSLNKSEDSITTNVDSISYGIRRRLAPFIGTYNRHPESIVLAKSVLDNELRYRQSSTYTVRAGNQLLDYKIVKFEPNVQFKDRLDVEVRLEVPYPYNYINITLVV